VEERRVAAMDYLHYDRAEQCFSFAAAIRQKIGQELSEVAVHDEHGAALAHQYRAIFSGSELSATERSRCLKDSHDAFA